MCTGANYMSTGDDPPLRDDLDYPEWLWGLAGPWIPTSELPPDSKQQWKRNRKEMARKKNDASGQF